MDVSEQAVQENGRQMPSLHGTFARPYDQSTSHVAGRERSNIGAANRRCVTTLNDFIEGLVHANSTFTARGITS